MFVVIVSPILPVWVSKCRIVKDVVKQVESPSNGKERAKSRIGGIFEECISGGEGPGRVAVDCVSVQLADIEACRACLPKSLAQCGWGIRLDRKVRRSLRSL